MNKQDLVWFIKDSLDYTFVNGDEEYPAEVHIDYDDLAEKLQEEFYTAEEVQHLQDKIEKLKTENERLNFYNDKLSQGIYFGSGEQFSNRIEQEKANAVRDFAEKLKSKSFPILDWTIGSDSIVFVNAINELLEEYDK